MDGELPVLAYEQAQARLQRQVARLSEGRSMASFLIAAHGLVASFLGAKALDPRDIGMLDILALITLVMGVLCAVRILSPIGDTEPTSVAETPVTLLPESERRCVTWRGAIPVDQVQALEANCGDVSIHVVLARELEARARRNAALLDRRLVFVQLCGWLLASQVILWSAALLFA